MLFPPLPRRREAEWMDEPGVDPATLRRSLAFIRRVNTRFGYTQATLSHLQRFSQNWQRDQPITILDIATGSADIPRAILDWARRAGLHAKVVGLDRHHETAAIARRGFDGDAPTGGLLWIVCGDAMCLPFADDSFDYVLTNMFLHHLDDVDVVRVLREMNRVARRGLIVADLLRNRRAYAWISLFTLFSEPILKHDARVSVAQAFTPQDALRLRDAADIGFTQFHRHFGHRFVLAGEKL